mmetsp:Transcript_65122/g.108191  ORF Transcript_65122/g.108191 Transcript_65122/m.108191 type:complete len:82 (-) Transcript_65122:534-779(-)
MRAMSRTEVKVRDAAVRHMSALLQQKACLYSASEEEARATKQPDRLHGSRADARQQRPSIRGTLTSRWRDDAVPDRCLTFF